jgi:MinD-like ATPase involved in chromosome partitioning or flagellar assembly
LYMASRDGRRVPYGLMASAVATLVLVSMLWLGAVLANPVRPVLQGLLQLAGWPSLVVAGLLTLAFVIVLASLGPAEATSEARVEPLLRRPSMPSCRRQRPLLSLHSLEPGAGATSLCFNFGVRLAAEGLVPAGDGARRPRPVCLLQTGRLTHALGLDPAALSDYLSRNQVSVGEELVGLAVRHPTGCELLAVDEGVLNGQRLKLLIPLLRRFYDAILIDCPAGDRWLTEVAVDLSELVLPVALATRRSASVAAAWADEAWRRGFEGRTAVVVNRVGAGDRVPAELVAGYLHQLEIPDDHLAAAGDTHGVPWVLVSASDAGRQLTEAVEAAVAEFFRQESGRAA